MNDKKNPTHPSKIKIVQAAVACFLDRGYHQTGVRDIARQADVSLGNLYNHFKGKEAVLAFIAEIEGEEMAGFIDLLSEPDDPPTALGRFIGDYAAYVSRPENALLGVEILAEAVRNPALADIFAKNRNQLIKALVDCLNTGARRGVFASYDDQHAVAHMVLDTLEGLGLRSLSKKVSDEAGVRTLRSIILNGLKP